ncbi:bifunctional folylpolyglutamate synthase/dihydrofolate synthase [Anaerobacillus isosaccharinicus]|uniref:Dihydrofolate synthase/folylpolyglutamate synthase n=1 Tax=Anaerobacillus isosaccharinicus TaxID=1532552 RepID=A0A1S2MED7_9BACI|nr:folylpolyglutamate synthase/dihydrofolate synthase family protein [Anaerobacillus isosaccharinicus]MBA5587829.1 bifunctional folylpolyglutamate synthase/dihydrofolate synthase [Anaerobacillus isosaccharinicus]QOY34017.1 bifunctional folylpolyglutamate synthase/dihydrofolate synthase [Anaerobacillus isosaccharinicus]
MISYEEACDIVLSASKFGVCLGLERMEMMLAELGNPQQQIPAIHLAGTNGKGSTLTYLSSIFQEAGYTVGTFTSPAINKINDKVKVNGVEIPDENFASIIEHFKPIIEKMSRTSVGSPTEFELMTAVAFQYFATQKPDIVLIETGLGGRLDSTNVIKPLVSIITNIGHDHMDLLGNTIREVAGEKAGIIKESVPVISGCKQEESIDVMKKQSELLSSRLFQLGTDFYCEHNGGTFSFIGGGNHFVDLKTGMTGSHQQENASLALMAIQCLPNFSISESAIRQGLMKAKIANRIEIVQDNPTIIFDGGHNPEGMEALASTLATFYSNREIRILFCAMKDKDINGMLQPLKDVATEIILTSFPYDRVMDPQVVFETFPLSQSRVIVDCSEAYRYIEGKSKPDSVFVVTGSLYFLNHIRNVLKK